MAYSINNVVTFKTVDAIGKHEIDKISKDPLFTYDWLKTVESTQSMDYHPVYVTLYDVGELVAFASCFIERTGKNFCFGPHFSRFRDRFLRIGKKVGLWKNDFLLCCSPYSCRSKILLGKNSKNNLSAAEIIKKMNGVCQSQSVLFSVFPFVSEFDKVLLNNLEKLGYQKMYFSTTQRIDVSWASFDDYLKSLKSRTRQNIKREIKKFEQSGIIIEEPEDISTFSDALSGLFANLLSKYEKEDRSLTSKAFYENVNCCAKNKVKVFIAKKDGITIGFSFGLYNNEVLDLTHCGFNYDLIGKTDAVYFNLAYYEPIKWAIKKGIKKIYYRKKAEEAKRRRGCKSEKNYCYIKCHNKAINCLLDIYFKTRINKKEVEF